MKHDMQPWKPGDPVARGLVYLPDKKTRDAYGKACKELWIEPAAIHAVSLNTLHERRRFIDGYPMPERDQLKAKVAELWSKIK